MIHFIVGGCDTTPATGLCHNMSWNWCTEGSCSLAMCGNSLELSLHTQRRPVKDLMI